MPTSSSSATERAQAARCRPTTSTLLRTAFVALRRIMHGEVVASAANASTVTSQAPLIASPTEWVHQLSAISGGTISHTSTRALYFNMLATLLTGAALVCNPSSAEQLEGCYAVFRAGSGAPTMKMKRTSTTMTGIKRLFNVRDLVIEVANKRLTGGYLEAGVWRGGNSIMAAATMQLYGLGTRPIYLCDSFHGLPLSRKDSPRPREGGIYQRMKGTLSVSAQRVVGNFDRFSIPREHVTIVPGYFVESLPGLRDELDARGEMLAVLRMDGDMYDSTADILFNLYDLVQEGGFVIIDDFGWANGAVANGTSFAKPLFGAKQALLDFRVLHSIDDPMKDIDGMGAYFQKTKALPSPLRQAIDSVRRNSTQYMRALKERTYPGIATAKELTTGDYYRMMKAWEASAGGAKATDATAQAEALDSAQE